MGYFAQIEDPVETRRGILEGSKYVLKAMHSYLLLQQIRKQKQEEMKNLRQELKELVVVINRLEDVLPHEEVKVKLKKKKRANIHKKAVEDNELARIKSALDKIEIKLKEL